MLGIHLRAYVLMPVVMPYAKSYHREMFPNLILPKPGSSRKKENFKGLAVRILLLRFASAFRWPQRSLSQFCFTSLNLCPLCLLGFLAFFFLGLFPTS
jgi:hypothetical protein